MVPQDEFALARLPEPLVWAVRQEIISTEQALEFYEAYSQFPESVLWRLVKNVTTPEDEALIDATTGQQPSAALGLAGQPPQDEHQAATLVRQPIPTDSDLAIRIDEIERSLSLRLTRVEEQSRLLLGENDYLKAEVARLTAQDTLAQGLLPDLHHVSLLEVQIFHTPELTKKQKQGRHTHWSLRIRVSVAGRRIKQEVNVSLYPGPEFAEQVFGTAADIPITIEQYANEGRIANDPDVLYGMCKLLTSGSGTPRSRRHFAILRGHTYDEPEVEIFVDDISVRCTAFRPGAGRRQGHAKWYGQCKPTLSTSEFVVAICRATPLYVHRS